MYEKEPQPRQIHLHPDGCIEGIKAGKVLFSGASDQSRGLAQNEVNSHKFGEESPNDVARLIQRRSFA